jgi:protein phosphatase
MSKSLKTIVFRRQVDFDQKEFIGDRELQEDYSSINFLKQQTELLFVLADGMGGHAGGEIASKASVDTFVKTFVDNPSESVPAKLGAALQQANNEINHLITSNPELDGMGCTLLGLYVSPQGIHWISVGDSPLFLMRKNQLTQLNADHSMAPLIEKSLLEGKITQDEAIHHPHRHILRSAVTGGELALIDSPASTFDLQAGDIIIAASDGILTLAADEILTTIQGVKTGPADTMTAALLAAVRNKRKPRQDNTTVQVFVTPKQWQSAGQGQSLKWLGIAAALVACLGVAAYFLIPNMDLKKLQEAAKQTIIEEKPVQVVKPLEITVPPSKEVESEVVKKDKPEETPPTKEKKEKGGNKDAKNNKPSTPPSSAITNPPVKKVPENTAPQIPGPPVNNPPSNTPPGSNPNGTPGPSTVVEPPKEVKKPEENKVVSPPTSVQEKPPAKEKEGPAPQAVQSAAETDKNK